MFIIIAQRADDKRHSKGRTFHQDDHWIVHINFGMGRNYIKLYQRRGNHCAMAPLMLKLPGRGKQVILMMDMYIETLIFLDIHTRTWLLMQTLTSDYTGEW